MLLIVEDNELVLYSYQIMFKEFEYYAAKNAKEALTFYKKHKVDLILLDMILGGMDGYEFCKGIRAIEDENKLEPVPIIAVSADESPSDGKANSYGLIGWMRKPLTIEKLRTLLSGLKLNGLLKEIKNKNG